MRYFKIIENEELVQLGTNNSYIPTNAEEITGKEYAELLAEFEAKWEQEEPTTDPTIDSIIEEVANNGY